MLQKMHLTEFRISCNPAISAIKAAVKCLKHVQTSLQPDSSPVKSTSAVSDAWPVINEGLHVAFPSLYFLFVTGGEGVNNVLFAVVTPTKLI